MPNPKHREYSRTSTCECGQKKRNKNAVACDRCAFLDGSYDLERRVIQVLRQRTRMTVEELMRTTRGQYRAVYNTLENLRRDRRVKRLVPEHGDIRGAPDPYLYELVTPRSMC